MAPAANTGNKGSSNKPAPAATSGAKSSGKKGKKKGKKPAQGDTK